MSAHRVVATLLVAGLALGCKSSGEAATKHDTTPEREPEPPPAELVAAVEAHVHALAAELPKRSLSDPPTLAAAADYIREQWTAQGYSVRSQAYELPAPGPGGAIVEVENLSVEIPGRRPELIIVGAHYDSAGEVPGADDNASGVAVLLELGRRLQGERLDATIRLVAFANEEPPYFKDPETMGSAVYAKALRESGAELEAMISVESVGYFSDEPGSQRYPAIVAPLYPDTGNFLGVVGKTGSRPLVRELSAALERHGPIPIERIAAPATITGIDWSDHWSFWQQGWAQAVMVTDTATFRNPHYHELSDTPETLDYPRLASVVIALDGAVRELASND